MIDALCQRWGVVPSQVMGEDAGLVLGILRAVNEQPEPQTRDERMMGQLADLSEVMGGG